MDKARFNSRIFLFFSDYLINRKTQYFWNNYVSPFFRTDINVGQGSTLFPILSALYITPIFHIFEKKTQNLLSSISVSTFFFVNNGPFIFQEKSFEKSNVNLFYSYDIISVFFEQFSLTIEYNKS